ncbi:phytoene desaturase family protein [Roseovarius nanhaiticus]|uniref:Pyridine nucleotide-disulfide oxidoreductase domain-containing protein 2 n=1 Tax=Roseovarius nanhaiticus TaxID=573024 RepID=A0A1N7HNB7_9RHOB|nr:NAD(P)/FAD-dependent oxidoreductase [Roseovarius nanhaiticus]SEL36388.1 Phytoene dehydrogenase-related protein [Roseovarius nanhaiticus]SIS26261.1 Phytoene dehydrogenase-related protein [Roseovarius nanhaiticus]
MSHESKDAIIIGSGHNSLICALYLLRAGWSVRVLEQAGSPGGAVKTSELTKPGFHHDWAAMNLSNFRNSAFYADFGEALEVRGAEFAHAEHCFASVYDDGSWFGVGTDREANLARVKALSEQDTKTWRALSDGFDARAGVIGGLMGSPMKWTALAGLGWSALRQFGWGGSLELARFCLSSPRDWLGRTFESDKIRAALAPWGMHIDYAPDIASGAIFPYLEAFGDQAGGMWLGRGGSGTIIAAMVAEIEAQGGTVECSAEVTRIIHEGGRARGVELADGRSLESGTVIANVAPGALARLTGGTGTAHYDAGLAEFRHAPGTVMIHLAVSDLPDWSAGPELREYAYVTIAPTLDVMARAYQQPLAGLLPEEPVVVVGQPTAIDPSRAPEGQHTLWLQVRMVPGEIAGDAAGEITATDWDGALAPFAERVLDLVERHAPGLRGRVLGMRCVSPLDLEADNPNLVGGDQVCGSHHLSQNAIFRPVRGYSDGTTPIDGLYHTGAAVWPGASTGGGPGTLLGKMLT